MHTEGLVHRKVGLDNEHGGPHDLHLLKDVAPTPVEDTVDPTNSNLWTLREGGREDYNR